MTARRVVLDTVIAAPPARVWRALTDPDEVVRWAGVSKLDVPAGYPLPGQHARWGARFGPLRVTLHDRVVAVEEGRRLSAHLAMGPFRAEEEYVLNGSGPGTRLRSANVVRSLVPGLGRVAAHLVQADVRRSLICLRDHCTGVTGPG